MEASENKPVMVILNSLTAAEQRAIGDRWAEHKGPRMTLAEMLERARLNDVAIVGPILRVGIELPPHLTEQYLELFPNI